MPFALKKETMEMEWTEQVGKENSQILLEGDMIVPDTKPDLQEILRCIGRVRLKEKRISDDRLSFWGEMEVCVLYRAKNGEKPLYAMKLLLPVEDFLHMEGLERGMDVSLKAETEHLDCRIINDRKIGVKAVLRLEAEAERQKRAVILKDLQGEGVETLKETLRMEEEQAAVKDRFTVREELSIPPNRPEIGEILTENSSLAELEIRPAEGKAAVRGKLCISLLYTDSEGNLGSYTEKIPFSGYLEKDSISPKTELTGVLTVEECRLLPAVDEDGETRVIHLDAVIGAELSGMETEEREILQDAYAPTGRITLKKEEITCPVTAARGRNQFTLRERIRLEEGEAPMLRTEMVWGEVCLPEGRIMENRMEAEGVLGVEILYHCADDDMPAALMKRGIPFLQTMELMGAEEGDTAELQLRLEDLDFQMLSEKEGELRATLHMEGAAKRENVTEAATDALWEEVQEERPSAGAVIYVVQKGDSLWKIAKKYRTTAADIAAVNELENPELIYPGQKLLIIRMKH